MDFKQPQGKSGFAVGSYGAAGDETDLRAYFRDDTISCNAGAGVYAYYANLTMIYSGVPGRHRVRKELPLMHQECRSWHALFARHLDLQDFPGVSIMILLFFPL